MGHAIGLGDRESTVSSCVRTGNMNGSEEPTTHDYETLYNNYSHDS